ncbi:MAG: adenosylmethionine--8-amino-7-oxononanoate transaminase [Flavobacteriales bacterium]|nr:adenosylmethionine--8-amino-7-oxononanoate transaminase [Flavobacteriales bacterium]
MKNAHITPIVKGEGVFLYDENGKKYIDAVSSWWVKIHGHSHPYIGKKIAEQFNELDHVIFAGFTHPKAVEVADRLSAMLPEEMNKIFFSDNGSTANEIALKMALQFWHNQGIVKTKVIAFEGAYHGDTFGGMSVSARSTFSDPFSYHLFNTEFIPTPTHENIDEVLSQFENLVKDNDVAAFIYEPLVQGVRGMVMYDGELLSRILEIAKNHQVLCIADEVMTGFGRTGTMFASDQVSIKPDIITLSKALTAGVMALGVTMCNDSIYDAFYSDDRAKAFLHGHSFTGNPLACAAVCANLDLLEMKETQDGLAQLISLQEEFRLSIENHTSVTEARQQGAILAIELLTNQDSGYHDDLGPKAYKYFLDRGVVMRPLGNVLIVMPPYCINKKDLNYVYAQIRSFLDEVKAN